MQSTSTPAWVIYTALVVLGLLLWVGVTIAGGWAMWYISSYPGGNSVMWPLLLFAVLPVLIGAGVPILLRDFWLRRRLAAKLGTVACTGCGYSLLGLSCVHHSRMGFGVDCPECGTCVWLAECGLAPADLRITESNNASDAHKITGSL